MRSPITTHILDTSVGRPAGGVPIILEIDEDGWSEVARGVTDGDGRLGTLLEPEALKAATYRLTFFVGSYWETRGETGFYPYVQVVFRVSDPDQHHHVPLLLNPYGYSTYRGS